MYLPNVKFEQLLLMNSSLGYLEAVVILIPIFVHLTLSVAVIVFKSIINTICTNAKLHKSLLHTSTFTKLMLPFGLSLESPTVLIMIFPSARQ